MVEALEFESADPDDLDLVEVPGIGVEAPLALNGNPVTSIKPSSGSGERVVLCLDCGTELRVSRQATSTLCRRCGCFVSLEDFEIRGHQRENIRTRGNVIIHRRASLSASEVVCDSLKVYGKISGKIDCSGDAIFRSSGKVVGAVRCRHLYIHKLSNIRFIPGIRADTAEIHGHVEGDIICEGTIRVTKTGAVYGDCIAPAVSLEDGASLSGQMRFMKPDLALEQEYLRRAQAAQEAYFARELEADLEAYKRSVGEDLDESIDSSGKEVA
jgi:cytoskeletal protein CcmA (bactofilin family)